mgnify:CR=1 FL=1
MRTKFRDEAPDTPYQDILRKISAVWNGMPEEEKKVSTRVPVTSSASRRPPTAAELLPSVPAARTRR